MKNRTTYRERKVHTAIGLIREAARVLGGDRRITMALHNASPAELELLQATGGEHRVARPSGGELEWEVVSLDVAGLTITFYGADRPRQDDDHGAEVRR